MLSSTEVLNSLELEIKKQNKYMDIFFSLYPSIFFFRPFEHAHLNQIWTLRVMEIVLFVFILQNIKLLCIESFIKPVLYGFESISKYELPQSIAHLGTLCQ